MSATSIPSGKPRRRWRTWVLALLIFLSGGFVGSAVTAVSIVRHVRYAVMHPEEAPARITARLRRPLDLTPQQSAKIRAIIASRQHALNRIRRQVQPQVETELSGLEDQIAEVLDPAQQQKWHALVARLRENWLPPVPAEAATTAGVE